VVQIIGRNDYYNFLMDKVEKNDNMNRKYLYYNSIYAILLISILLFEQIYYIIKKLNFMYNFHILLFIIFRNYVLFSNKFIRNNKLSVIQIVGRNDYYTFFNG
jgi:hypothetical protein